MAGDPPPPQMPALLLAVGSIYSPTGPDQEQRARRRSASVGLSFLYRLVGRVLEMLRVHRMDAVAKDVESLVLRHSFRCSAVRSPSPLHLVRRGVDRNPRQPRSCRAVALVPRHATDDPRLARQRRPATVDLPAPPTRSCVTSHRDGRADLPAGEREPALGLSAHRRRAQEARRRRVEDESGYGAPP